MKISVLVLLVLLATSLVEAKYPRSQARNDLILGRRVSPPSVQTRVTPVEQPAALEIATTCTPAMVALMTKYFDCWSVGGSCIQPFLADAPDGTLFNFTSQPAQPFGLNLNETGFLNFIDVTVSFIPNFRYDKPRVLYVCGRGLAKGSTGTPVPVVYMSAIANLEGNYGQSVFPCTVGCNQTFYVAEHTALWARYVDEDNDGDFDFGDDLRIYKIVEFANAEDLDASLQNGCPQPCNTQLCSTSQGACNPNA